MAASIHPIVLFADERPRNLVKPIDPITGRVIDMRRDTVDQALDTLVRQYRIYRERHGRLVSFEAFVEIAEFLRKVDLPETKYFRRCLESL
jgi:hypothetical protein